MVIGDSSWAPGRRLRNPPNAMHVDSLPAFLKHFLAYQFKVLGGFGPAFEVVHRAGVGSQQFEHLTSGKLAQLLPGFDDRHWTLGAAHVEFLLSLSFVILGHGLLLYFSYAPASAHRLRPISNSSAFS